jgi:hypothetical protein
VLHGTFEDRVTGADSSFTQLQTRLIYELGVVAAYEDAGVVLSAPEINTVFAAETMLTVVDEEDDNSRDELVAVIDDLGDLNASLRVIFPCFNEDVYNPGVFEVEAPLTPRPYLDSYGFPGIRATSQLESSGLPTYPVWEPIVGASAEPEAPPREHPQDHGFDIDRDQLNQK